MRFISLLSFLLLAVFLTGCEQDTAIQPNEPQTFDSYVDYRGHKQPLTNSYQTTIPIIDQGLTVSNFVFTTTDVAQNGRLTGTSDMIAFHLVAEGDELAEGSYRIDDNYDLAAGNLLSTLYCESMNFTTGDADDDQPGSEGTVTVSALSGDTYQISFDLMMQDNAPLTAEYTGPVVLMQQ